MKAACPADGKRGTRVKMNDKSLQYGAEIRRLTENLFVSQSPTEKTNHPSEDLTSALISASSGMSIKIPGIGEIAIDRKGIDKFKRGLANQNENA